eukprot:scaffold7542_cov124-Isochrysis_galbana.AAC.11
MANGEQGRGGEWAVQSWGPSELEVRRVAASPTTSPEAAGFLGEKWGISLLGKGRNWFSVDRDRSGEGPILWSAGRGGGGARLVGSMPPSKLRRGWVEVGRGVALFPVVRVHPPRRS